MGLYNVQQLCEHYKINDYLVFSSASPKHFDGVVADSYVLHADHLNNMLRPSDIIVMPNYLDPHFDQILRLINYYQERVSGFFIPGRNLLFDRDRGKFLWRGGHDLFLHDGNIEHLMEEALGPFLVTCNNDLKSSKLRLDRHEKTWQSDVKTVFINSFSSQPARDFSLELLCDCVSFLKDKKIEQVYISEGMLQNSKDRKLTASAKECFANCFGCRICDIFWVI